MHIRRIGFAAAVVLVPSLGCLLFARSPSEDRTLLVTGYPGEAPVLENNGHLYVDVDVLARITNGSLSFRDNQIVLTLQPVAADSAATTRQGDRSEFSRPFLTAAIEQLAVIREWQSALVNGVRREYPITEDWMNTFSSQAQKNLALVAVALSTASDRHAYELLTNEYNNMKTLSDRFVDANISRTRLAPSSLDDDPLDQQILTCAHALAAMAASGKFTDDSSCH